MSFTPQLTFDDGGGACPHRVPLAPAQNIRPYSITARWDGSGAGGAFLPCLAIYSQDGKLLSRTRPEQEFAAGDSGVVTYAPFLNTRAELAPVGAIVPYVRFIDEQPTPSDFTFELRAVPQSGGASSLLSTHVNEGVRYPRASPDGALVAFLVGPTLAPDLYVVGADGSGETLLDAGVIDCAWSPDGSRIVYTQSGVGIKTVTPGGTIVDLGVVGSRPQYSPDGAFIAFWDEATDDLKRCDADGANVITLDNTLPATNIRHQLSWAHSVAMIGYGASVTNTFYWRILVDGTGLTALNAAGYNVNSNPLVTHTCFEPGDTYYMSQKFASAALGWQLIKVFVDGTTAPSSLPFFTSGNTGAAPYVFGDRIYFVKGPDPDGAPLVSVALDGSDERVEDDANGGDPLVELTLE